MTSYLMAGCQAVVAVTFGYSAATKLSGRAAYADFRRWLSASAGAPPQLASAVVAVEAATAVAMLIPPLVPAGLVVATLLLVVFTRAVHSMIRRRVRVPCRCFGTGRRPPGAPHLARNLILLAVAAAGGVLAMTGSQPPPIEEPSVLAAIAGGTVALLLINLDEIVDLARPRTRAP